MKKPYGGNGGIGTERSGLLTRERRELAQANMGRASRALREGGPEKMNEALNQMLDELTAACGGASQAAPGTHAASDSSSPKLC